MSVKLLKNGEVVMNGGVHSKDIVINGSIIEAVVDRGKVKIKIDEEIDCKGKIIIPGVIDVHVHFREPGASYKEDWETGSRAAVSGGVTTVFDMPNNNPPVLSIRDLENKRELINGRSYVNFGLYIGYDGKNIGEINNSSNISGVKVFCAHSTGDMGVDEKYLDRVFKEVDKEKLLVFHAEDEKCIEELREKYLAEFEGREIDPSVHSRIRGVECAVKMVREVCKLAKKYKRPIHICHVSTEEELEEISKYRGLGVTCEVTPHHLTLSEDDYSYFKNYIVVNPPVRSRIEVFGVWKGLKAGLVDIFASDHAPHTREEKEVNYEKTVSGVPGVEMMLPILLNTVNNGGMSIEEVVYMCCQHPAEIFHLKGKGKIDVGYDADLVVVDMEVSKEFNDEDVISKCGWSPYSGSVYKGWPVKTFVNGQLVFNKGEFISDPCGKEVKF